MPTAAKLVAAVTLAMAAYAASTVLLYHAEVLQTGGGISHKFFGMVGFVIGWNKLGPAAERGYQGGWSGGIAAAITVYISCVIIAACHHIYKGFYHHAFYTVDEMLDVLFTKSIEYALYITTWQVFASIVAGGLLAGTFAAMAGRVWR